MKPPKIVYPENFADPALPKGVFSPSQYGMFKRCPRQYYYRYILGKSRPPGIAALKGSAVHKGAEVTHKRTMETGTPAPLEEAKAAVADRFERGKDSIEDWKDLKPGMVKDLVVHNFSVYYRTAVPLINPIKVEYGFAHKFGTVPVIGYIDLVDKTGEEKSPEGEIMIPAIEVVSDLKTAARKWPPQRIHKDAQLTFYAHAENTPNVRIDFLLDQKSGTKYVREKSLRDPKDVSLLIEDLEQAVDLIKKGTFLRCSPTEWNCTEKFCGFYEECR